MEYSTPKAAGEPNAKPIAEEDVRPQFYAELEETLFHDDKMEDCDDSHTSSQAGMKAIPTPQDVSSSISLFGGDPFEIDAVPSGDSIWRSSSDNLATSPKIQPAEPIGRPILVRVGRKPIRKDYDRPSEYRTLHFSNPPDLIPTPDSRYAGMIRFPDTCIPVFEAFDKWIQTGVLVKINAQTSLPNGTTVQDLDALPGIKPHWIAFTQVKIAFLYKFGKRYGNLKLRRDAMIALQQMDILDWRNEVDPAAFLLFVYERLPHCHTDNLYNYMLRTTAIEWGSLSGFGPLSMSDLPVRSHQVHWFRTMGTDIMRDITAASTDLLYHSPHQAGRTVVPGWWLVENACRWHEHENVQDLAQCPLRPCP
ncbi:hypothetical protein BU16DRAFT_129771 [Lophium mytilinum]|uniref:Uncharacterized protein n=1 Tax=Lophium mytilinum TaxID=390894 RepID=A0A6A6QIF8_9PEZI|nr:hypothetical protein BU16DRAFT_129771 [Lophium mytilinum]